MGLILGALLGGGGTYLALERPWAGEPVAAAADAGPEVVDSGKGKKGKRRKKGRKRKPSDVEIALTGDDIPDLSAADRKLMWKGDAVSLPGQSVDMGSDDGGRPLNGSEIRSTIDSQSGGILGCITTSRGNAPLKATIKAKMLVDGGGQVKKSRFQAPRYLFDHGFYGCARKAASGLRFPATGGFTVVEVPYDLF